MGGGNPAAAAASAAAAGVIVAPGTGPCVRIGRGFSCVKACCTADPDEGLACFCAAYCSEIMYCIFCFISSSVEGGSAFLAAREGDGSELFRTLLTGDEPRRNDDILFGANAWSLVQRTCLELSDLLSTIQKCFKRLMRCLEMRSQHKVTRHLTTRESTNVGHQPITCPVFDFFNGRYYSFS
jgi:hypothetical protein